MALSDKLCKYANRCSVYSGKQNDSGLPGFVLKNIFCKDGQRGWSGCKRYQLFEKDIEVPDTVMPNSQKNLNQIINEINLG
jgi:hypothetical protein